MRCFIAVPVSGELARRCAVLAEGKGRVVPQANLHLTLQFLGEVSAVQQAALPALLEQVGREHGAFDVPLGRAQAFPSPVGPLYVLALAATPPLQALQMQLARQLATLGFATDPRPWRPHITLARPGRADGPQELIGLLPVAELVLYQSVPNPAGPPSYSPLHIVRLRQKAPLN